MAGTIVIKKPKRTLADQSYVVEITKGLGVTLKHFFKNFGQMVTGTRPDVTKFNYEDGVATLQYPEEKKPYPRRFRGVHRLTKRSNGEARCTACLMCSTACPAQCIFIKPGEYPEGHPSRGHERYAVEFVIDELRCIFCGFCVEACPVDAIRMDTGIHMTALDNRADFIFDKEKLMSFPSQDGDFETSNTRVEPGDKAHHGITREQGH
ncbi:MAG: NADH-quinone oxidoreductase subunit I [Deltaproteobacteria bacterium]|nr:NADH-quinone oxidoreductase subunit I [Deltaproteobacteria bacterium]